MRREDSTPRTEIVLLEKGDAVQVDPSVGTFTVSRSGRYLLSWDWSKRRKAWVARIEFLGDPEIHVPQGKWNPDTAWRDEVE